MSSRPPFRLSARSSNFDDNDSRKGASGLWSAPIAMAQGGRNRPLGNPVTHGSAHATAREPLRHNAVFAVHLVYLVFAGLDRKRSGHCEDHVQTTPYIHLLGVSLCDRASDPVASV
jgi:hypothetical protein